MTKKKDEPLVRIVDDKMYASGLMKEIFKSKKEVLKALAYK